MIDLTETTTVETPDEETTESTTTTTEKKNTQGYVGSSEISCDIFKIDEMTTNYMFGISLTDEQGNQFPDSMIASYLNGAIAWAEQLFDICLTERDVEAEYHDYERNDYQNWGYIQAFKRPIQSVTSLRLMYGGQPSFTVPVEWLKIDKMGGKIQMFPAQGSANNLIISQTGVIFGLQQRWGYAPQMWELNYKAGMTEKDIPENLKVLIYKKCAIDVFTVWGDLIIGAGIANQSISIDGLSQSIGTTQSAMYGGASARVQQYKDDIENEIPIIRMALSSPRMVVL
jgi:hypothetical protein